MSLVRILSIIILFVFQGSFLVKGEPASDVNRLNEKLKELQSRVEASVAREIVFKEERIFPFRNKPIELDGVLRLWNDVGISISYPESRTVLILDDLGLLMRKISQDGSFREKSSGVEDASMIHLLKAAFEFDRSVLEQLFSLKLIEDADQWSLVMVPVDDQEKKIEAVIISGHELLIDRIELAFAGKKKIRIIPLEEREKSGFPEDVQRLYFRSSAK